MFDEKNLLQQVAPRRMRPLKWRPHSLLALQVEALTWRSQSASPASSWPSTRESWARTVFARSAALRAWQLTIRFNSDFGAAVRQAISRTLSTIASLAYASRTLVLPRRPQPPGIGTKVLGAACMNMACCSDVRLTV